MRKSIHVVLYLAACTLVIFYSQRFLSNCNGSSGKDPWTHAADAHMAQDAYFSLREVAGVQLGHISITYRIEEVSGRYLARFRNDACPNPEADPGQLREYMENQQDELHERILLLGPCADVDGSGFVTKKEGADFRDLCAFGHLAAYCRETGNADLARAAGLGAAEADRNRQLYGELVTGCPIEVREFFPAAGD